MGYTFDVKCEKCDYNFSANVGIGMLDCDFFEIDFRIDKSYLYGHIEEKKIIDDICFVLETKENISRNLYGSSQYVCSKCGRLYNNFNFQLTFTGGTYEPDYFCKECKNKLTLVNIENGELIDWQCPLCGHSKLIKDHSIDIYFD